MAAEIGVNGNPVSLDVACDVCGEPPILGQPAEFVGGEWVCVSCAECIGTHTCPICGGFDEWINPEEQHVCGYCLAERDADGDYEDSLPYRMAQR